MKPCVRCEGSSAATNIASVQGLENPCVPISWMRRKSRGSTTGSMRYGVTFFGAVRAPVLRLVDEHREVGGRGVPLPGFATVRSRP